MKSVAVIGKNFGDEGKGLACAFLCRNAGKCLVIKHNGGGQAGHTVEDTIKGKKFVHHQIGSGAEYGADTLFADSFHPDLYQLKKEISEFKELFGFIPVIYSSPDAEITTVDDVLLNMGSETARGSLRHGSCGMGINECEERINAGFTLTVRDVLESNIPKIVDKLELIRKSHTSARADELEIDQSNPYFNMLSDPDILYGYAEEISSAASLVKLADVNPDFISGYDNVIFENGQGLLLDNDYVRYAPHLTPSRTGLYNPVTFLSEYGLPLDEVIYVTRTYITRHGAGPLPCECSRDELPEVTADMTNEPNEWQGSLRYAKHESAEAFAQAVIDDVSQANSSASDTEISLLVTHMNETGNMIAFRDGNLSLPELINKLPFEFDNIYVSDNHMNMRLF